jgi:aryl-alcohol dehydrogenase-like predicted oxidoreductase
MEYRRLGTTGVKVSELCMGTMQFGWTADEATSLSILDAAEAAGINFIDTADVYSRWAPGNPGGVAETIVGEWLRASAGRRSRTVVATKVRGEMGEAPNDKGLSRAHIVQAVEGSLRRLGIETIDLYQVHWPDEETSIEETLGALDQLTRQGKVLYLGCSNFPAWRLMQALWVADRDRTATFVCLQPNYSLLKRAEYERELEEVCRGYGLGVIPYSPLAGGFLTGKYRRGQALEPGTRAESSSWLQAYLRADRSWDVLQALQTAGEGRGRTPSQMALGWLLTRPTITSPIIGPRTIPQLQDNLGAVGLRLDASEMEALDQVSAWT